MMRKRIAIPIPLLLLATACAPTPSWYGVPPQHKPIVDNAPAAAPIPNFGEFVTADEASAERYFIKDVKGLESTWRWTLVEPEFRFLLSPVKRTRRFQLKFGINDRTFKDTGPVTLEIYVNGNPVGKPTFKEFGDHTWETDVDPWKLLPGAENRVLVKVVNPWQTADPGVKLGVVFQSAGFLSK